MNIMSLVMQYFGPVILNKIAGSVGINSTLAQKAIAAAAPAILGGILGRTTQPGGAKILADMIGKQDPGLLGKLGELIGTGKQASIVEQGTSALGGLLGNSALGSLAGALSKQAGLGIGASNTLLGLVTPAILGTLGREQKSAGLDAAGLANMLMGQKKNIADAIPADFAKLLSGTGLLDAVEGKNGNGSATAATTSTMATKPAATTTPASAARPATAAPATSRPGMSGSNVQHHHHFSWTPWIAAIAAASALWWSVFGNKLMDPHPMTTNIPAVVPPSTTLATTPLPAVVASTEAGKQILSVIDDMKGAISGVRDAATAQSSLTKIQDVAGRLEKVNTQAAQLTPEARRALATYVNSQQGLLKTAVTNALALPGVSGLLKPILDQMIGRIESLAKA
jgi:Bacterial protein of unknown function (DUF937)